MKTRTAGHPKATPQIEEAFADTPGPGEGFDDISASIDDEGIVNYFSGTNLASPMSEETTLRASAGHGATTLGSIRELDGAITVSVEEASCFGITATVDTTTSQHRFTRSDLVLRP